MPRSEQKKNNQTSERKRKKNNQEGVNRNLLHRQWLMDSPSPIGPHREKASINTAKEEPSKFNSKGQWFTDQRKISAENPFRLR